jgi:hypothetical protein
MHKAYRVVVVKSEKSTPLGRPRHRWESNVKTDLQYDVKTVRIKVSHHNKIK